MEKLLSINCNFKVQRDLANELRAKYYMPGKMLHKVTGCAKKGRSCGRGLGVGVGLGVAGCTQLFCMLHFNNLEKEM